jgi:hypothetical protein
MAYSHIDADGFDPNAEILTAGTSGWRQIRDNIVSIYDDARDCVIKSAGESVNNSTVYQDDDELHWDALANEVWIWELRMIVTSPAAAGIKAQLSLPSSGTHIGTVISGLSRNVPATADEYQFAMATSASGSIYPYGALAGDAVTLRGIVEIGAVAGTVTVQWAQYAAVVGDTTVAAGSTLHVHRVSTLPT